MFLQGQDREQPLRQAHLMRKGKGQSRWAAAEVWGGIRLKHVTPGQAHSFPGPHSWQGYKSHLWITKH